MLPKINNWLSENPESFPRRILISGGANAIDEALEIAAHFQQTTVEKIESGIHTDTVVFHDKGKSFKIDYSDAAQKDGQSEHENARGLIKWMHRTPSEAPFRIAVLEGLERMSRESPHALLKLIEEPPKDAFLIFTTKNHHQILDTILSRVTLIRLPKQGTERTSPYTSVAQEFLESQNLIFRFRTIEDLDKDAKKEKDRTILPQFVEAILYETRNNKALNQHLPLVFETLQALKRNQNQRFCVERLALKMNP